MIVELNYLSPDSSYKFNKNKSYILTLINTSTNNVSYVYKQKVNNLNNITRETKGYPIKKAIRLTSSLFGRNNYSVKIFEQDSNLKLIFSGSLELDNMTIHNPTHIQLKSPSNVLGNLRKSNYSGDNSFLNEQFYNFNTYNSSNNRPDNCFMFIKLVNKSNLELLKPTSVKFDDSNNLYVFDRYANTVVRELQPASVTTNNNGSPSNQQNDHYQSFISSFCNSSSSYTKFLEAYQRDDNIYLAATDSINFFSLMNRKIKPEFRPLMSQQGKATLMVAPADCRVRGFNINPTLGIKAYNSTYSLANLVDDPQILYGGSGFLCRVSPQDYHRVHLPYEASIKKIVLDDNIVSLRFESDYFMPDSTQERDRQAVIYGNYLHTSTGGRNYPELMNVQPDTHLVYYVVTISLNSDLALELTNQKLKTNSNKIKPSWFEQGEELGKIACGNSYVLVLCNRRIDFSPDIEHFSKLRSSSLKHPIDSFVKLRDQIGGIL